VLRLIPGLERASLYALHHHEKFDGSGYPSRLKGEEIPIGARIVAVIDAFDAMVASRPYKEGLPIEEALRRLALDSGRHFDPAVVRHFVPIASARDAVGVRGHGRQPNHRTLRTESRRAQRRRAAAALSRGGFQGGPQPPTPLVAAVRTPTVIRSECPP